ncbi:protein misato [Coccinella septempunctata]|uniref:protein misato n=1 Tax=Coccinella septempunctata TaxID=41139 RepID=UPI001D078657|nr:protein misato [Coccinella septempunctata]
MNFDTTSKILTLQFGHYSNFVGTHWWNVQEKSFQYSGDTKQDINHDVLYRDGINNKGQETYTPRLLLVDLKGSSGALPAASDLYEDNSEFHVDDIQWETDRVEVKTEEKLKKNEFQKKLDDPESSNQETGYDFDKNVNVWSDFLYTRFHPRTLNIVKDFQHQSNSFNAFHQGSRLWSTEQFQNDFIDKIRNYVEECDYFQGCQVLLDAVDGFSGLATSSIEHLYDEYGRSVVAFPLIPSFYKDYNHQTEEERSRSIISDSNRVLNLAFCFDSLREICSLFVPLCTGETGWRQPGNKREFYHTNYNPELYYHSGAILAAALDTISLKYRLKSGNYKLKDLCKDLTNNNRMAAAASMSLPFSLNCDSDLVECLDNWEGPLTRSITPNCNLGSERMVQLYTLRGISEEKLKKPLSKAGRQKDLPAYKCKTVEEMLQFYLSCTTTLSLNHATSVSNSLEVGEPFPKIFDEFVGFNGSIIGCPRPSTLDVQSVPVLTGLHSGSGIGKMLETLLKETKRINISKFPTFSTLGIDKDAFSDSVNNLYELKECYEEDYYL